MWPAHCRQIMPLSEKRGIRQPLSRPVAAEGILLADRPILSSAEASWKAENTGGCGTFEVAILSAR